MRRRFLFVFLMSVSASAAAQLPIASLSPGNHVRLTAPSIADGSISGSILKLDSRVLQITRKESEAPTVIPIEKITSMEYSAGHGRLIGALKGMAIGLGAGVVLGVACVSICKTDANSGANLAPIGGGLLGLPIGAAIGALIARERWEPVFISQ